MHQEIAQMEARLHQLKAEKVEIEIQAAEAQSEFDDEENEWDPVGLDLETQAASHAATWTQAEQETMLKVLRDNLRK